MGDQKRICVVGGGAAGFFAALTVAELNPNAKVVLHERGRDFLQKVKVSGGGRCNVTHGCFDPARLASHYPRGSRELRGAFHRWQPQDTINWFEERGVALKTEADGRMFPETDDSQTIIDCFLKSARESGVILHTGSGLEQLTPGLDGSISLRFSDGRAETFNKVCLASGSLKGSVLSDALRALGHSIEPLAPSLFAFNVSDRRIEGLSGLSIQDANVRVLPAAAAPQSGPLLITHRGLSGPAILRLSAWEARALQTVDYRFEISVNWLGSVSERQLREQFAGLRKRSGKATVRNKSLEAVPRRLWERMMESVGIGHDVRWAHLPAVSESTLVRELIDARYAVTGKTTNKVKVNNSLVAKGMKKEVPAEFVTAGGISRKEIDWRTMESRIVPGLHFAGECIDYDGITGGFNFQGAWTTGRIAGLAMIES